MKARLVGVFVGGQSRRMGGKPKGNLLVPGTSETILERLLRLSSELGIEAVLVGDASPYASVGKSIRVIADRPAGIGPMGGLAGLLELAGERATIALSCDVPFLSLPVVRRLAESDSSADVVAARRSSSGPWEPLIARYLPKPTLIALSHTLSVGTHSLQSVLARLRVEPLATTPAEARDLMDWDTPEDVQSSPS